MSGEARKLDPARAASAAAGEDFSDDALELTRPPSVPGTAPKATSYAGRYAAGSIVSGKYQLQEVLGEGGMGSVWVAKNRTLDLEVALKLMRAELAEDVEGIAERMLQEARAAASIGHPAIIQVFDFGYSELGDPFIVMEVLRGENLSQLIRRRGRLHPKRAVQTLLPIVDALSAAHARGIVHRDMKPENIFLARSAGKRIQPKVLDFGIAKLEQRAAERLTRDGAVIGSPAYMAPEQLRGDPQVDARADLWAISVVLYEMISGQRPFSGDSYHASMWNVLNAEPRPLEEHGVSEPELFRVIQRGLSKTADKRHPDLRSFGRELARWLLARGVQEDICQASLRFWLDDDAVSLGRLHSFFPSQEPSAPELLRAEVEAIAALEPSIAIESSGTRRVVETRLGPPPSARAAKPAPAKAAGRRRELLGGRKWLLSTLLGAALAFVCAAVWGILSSSEPEPEPADPLPVLSRARRAQATTASTGSSELRSRYREPAPEPDPDQVAPAIDPEPRPTKTEPLPARRPVRAAPRRVAPKTELKNPFG